MTTTLRTIRTVCRCVSLPSPPSAIVILSKCALLYKAFRLRMGCRNQFIVGNHIMSCVRMFFSASEVGLLSSPIMTTTLRSVRTICRCISLRSSISSLSRRHFAVSTTSASTPVPTLFGTKEIEAPIESPEKRQAIVYLTQQLETSIPTPDQLPSLLSLAQQHHLSYFIHQITRLTLASQHTSLYQYADAGEWDQCETWLREKYSDDANKLPHYEAYTLNMKNPYEIEKEPPPFKLLRSGMKIRKELPPKEEQTSKDEQSDNLLTIIQRAKHRKAEEKAANEAARLERQAKNSFPKIQEAPTKYPITFFHVIELLDACGWEHLSRAAYQHAIDTGYIATPAIRMHNYMIYAVSLPRRITSIAVRTWLHDIKQRYDVLKKMPKEDLQIILGKGWRGKYDNPIATLVRQDIIDMLQSQYGMASEISPSNNGILLVHKSEIQKWILSHIPTNNLILPLPAQIHVKGQSIEQATAAVSSLMNEIIRQFEFGQSPQHGLHIVTGIGQSYVNQHSSAPYVPILREPLLKLLHETYDLEDAHVDTRDESMIRISKNQMERWLRYRIWKRQIPTSLQSQVAHIKPDYGVPSSQNKPRKYVIVPAHIQQLQRK